jgi:hypothetical protein
LTVYTNDADTAIAESIDDAELVLKEYGYTEVDLETFDVVEPGEEITIHCDASGAPACPGDPGVSPITKTAAEWVQARGRGFLCTSEY